MKNEILVAQGLTKTYWDGDRQHDILKDLDISIYDNDFTVIMGPSGSGKSTLLYSISGMNRIEHGEILYKGKDISKINEKEMASLRANEFGFVFQQIHLISNLTLYENVTVAGYLNTEVDSKQVDEEAKQLLHEMNIEHAIYRYPAKVSGGEAQRGAMARALIQHPNILFADEPTGALNRKNSDEILKLLSNLHEQGQTIVMVTHDLHAAAYGNRILYLEDGKILDEYRFKDMHQDHKQKESLLNEWLTKLSW